MLKYGTDPEVFSTVVRDGKDFVISPALLEKFSGIKPIFQDRMEKHPVYISNKEFNWMMDGVAWEITVLHPIKNSKEMFKILNNSLECLEEFISKLNYNGESLNLFKKPVVQINPQEYIPYLSERKIHQGFIFGCDTDWDAIVENYICQELDVETHLWRYGGGHLHISGEELLYKYPNPAVKLLAITVGNYCIKNSPYPELEKQRSQTYGKPGRFRPQVYPGGEKGIEYRSPSNSWISYPEEKMEELFFWIQKGVDYLKNPEIGTKVIAENLNDTISAIVNSDQNLSESILKNLT